MQEDSYSIFLERLLSAVQSQDVAQVKRLLESEGVSLGEQNSSLYKACQLHNVEIVKLLLQHGADVDGDEGLPWDPFLISSDPSNSIHCACNGESDHTELAKCFIDGGCNVNVQDEHFASALTYATYGNNVPLVNLLIESGADVNVEDTADLTPLEIAARQTNVKLMKCLLNAGADQESNNRASLHTCLQLDFHEGLKLLYKDSQTMVCDTNEYSQQRILEVYKTRSRLVDNFDSYAPATMLPLLLTACSSPISDPWKVVQTLLDLGVDVYDKDQSGFNCLQHACSRVNVKCVRVLLDYGVNPVDHTWEKLWTVFPALVNTQIRFRGYFQDLNERVPTFRDYLGILKLLVSAGFKIDEESARVFTDAVRLPYASAWSEEEKSGFTSFLKSYRTVPMSLVDCCRINVRQCLKTNIEHSIGKLENSLPLVLMNYLKFGDIFGPLN